MTREGNPATGQRSRRVRDVVFAEPESEPLLLDLVLPADRPEPAPVIVWLHGGGWFTGDRTLAPDLNRHFADRGFAMATVEYRLSGAALFPAQLFDVRSAIRFLRRNARRFGIDPEAIGLWGSSSGGHLAALAGVSGHLPALRGESDDSGDASVQAVAEGYGPIDLAAVVETATAKVPGMAGENAPESRLLGGLPSQRADLAAFASPLSHVSSAAPPFQIAHGTADELVPDGQSVELHAGLAKAGAECTLYLLDGFRHGFLNPAGRVDLDGPRVMDDGRLEVEPEPSARYRHARPGRGQEEVGIAVFSFDVIGDFFTRHLRRGDHGY